MNRSSYWHCLAAVLWLTAAGWGSAARAQANPPESVAADSLTRLPVGRLGVSGNQSTDERLILRTTGLAEGEPASPSRLRTAVRALYGLGLFSAVTIQDSLDAVGKRNLTIVVSENPRITSLAWKGNKKLSEDDLKNKCDIKPGQLLTDKKLFEARRAIEAAYLEEGFASAKIDPVVTDPVDGKVELTFNIEEGKKVSIRALEFTGNAAFPTKKLRGQAVLKPNSWLRTKRYTAGRLREDEEKFTEFYRNNGYKDAKVTAEEPEFSEDRREVRLRYRVEEGPLYRFGQVEWTGNSVVSEEKLRFGSAILMGAPYSKAKLDATTAAAYEEYTERGYLLELSVIPETHTRGDTVDVSYTISEGAPSHVHEVTILGNTRTREHVVRRELSLIPGQLLRRSVLLRSQRDVFALGYFEDVQIDYQPTGQGSDVDVSYTVKEKSSGTATAGAAYSGATGLTGFVNFGHNNLFGKGWATELHLERGGRRATYNISFTEPWFLGTPTSLGFQIYDMSNEYDLYTEKQRGIGLNVGRPWFFKTPDFSRVYAGYSLEHVRYADPADEQEEIILKSFQQGTASRLNLSFVRNSTDNPFYPTSGSKTTARLEFSGGFLGGKVDYYKPLIDHRTYFVPFWKPALMVRHRLSWLGALKSGRPVPGSETFRLGGTRADYLRGYPDYEIVPEENIQYLSDGRVLRFPGGKVTYAFTAEYGFLLVNPVHGLFFLDAGNAWNSARDFSLNDLKKSIGAGIRLEIPMLGPVGFDYAYGLDRGRWQAHFIIGPAF